MNNGRIIVMRHGESDHNVSAVYNSDPDHSAYKVSNLTEKGKKQARESAQAIRKMLQGKTVAAIYASPLPRTQQTAREVSVVLGFPASSVITDNRLTETRMGGREGQPAHRYVEKDEWFPDKPVGYGGELTAHVRRRMLDFYHELMMKSQADNNPCIIVVTHGAPAYLLIESVVGSGDGARLDPAGFFIINASQHP